MLASVLDMGLCVWISLCSLPKAMAVPKDLVWLSKPWRLVTRSKGFHSCQKYFTSLMSLGFKVDVGPSKDGLAEIFLLKQLNFSLEQRWCLVGFVWGTLQYDKVMVANHHSHVRLLVGSPAFPCLSYGL